MIPPHRESVAAIARYTGINTQTLYNWGANWQKEVQLLPVARKAPGRAKLADTQP
jgi:transposase-like protein